MLERPPILRGSEREQLAALRDYLVRLARELEAPAGDPSPQSAGQTGAPTASARTAPELKQEAAALRSLIVKTAHSIERSVERLGAELHEDYLALSDFGSYAENIEASFEATARGVVESYDYAAALSVLGGELDGLSAAAESIRGQIRRGLITDPESGETAMGIAISEELRFTGAVQTENGLDYYVLAPGQTLGLYTASGWQFWIGGAKRGWFDSVDGMLHVLNLAVETSLSLGAGWVLTSAGGLGLKVTGG